MKDAAVYAVGNGSVIAYGREMDWIQVFGSPYTIPTVFSIFLPPYALRKLQAQ